MAKKIWVLDTETKGTGANVVPLESTLRKPAGPRRAALRAAQARSAAPGARPRRGRRAPTRSSTSPPARSWREDVDTRAAIRVLEGLGSVVDVRIYVWDDTTEHWVLLTLGEHKSLWDYRGKLGPEPASP